jgi:hypothetical protein
MSGVECYLGTPTVVYPKDKVLLYITDVFGYSFVNCKVRPPNNLNDINVLTDVNSLYPPTPYSELG